MSVPKPIGDPKLLSRPINRNPRFSDVDSVVDTGSTINTVQRVRESEVSVKRNPGENFRRLRPGTVVRLVAAAQQPPQERDADDYALPAPPPATKVLLLDVRDRDEYDACHISSAMHYPAMMLNRSTNQFPAELLAFKNKENHLVVIYDLEEEIVTARKVGNVFFERGFDNIAVISGGLKEFVQEHSDMITGPPPCPIIPRKTVRTPLSSAARGPRDLDAASTRATSVATSHKPKSLSTSLARRGDGGKSWR